MKPVSELLHRTPWWAMILAGLATFAGLAVFITPYHLISYRDDGKTVEESRAIKREIDNAFAENAINVGRGVVRGMLARTTDPERRAELEQALAGLEEARTELRVAGAEVMRAKREALEAARAHTAEIARTVDAARETLEAAREGTEPKEVRKEHEAALKELQKALREARRAEREAERTLKRAERNPTIGIGPKIGDEPIIQVEIDAHAPPAKPTDSALPALPTKPTDSAMAALPAPPAVPAEAAPPLPPLPPEVASRIRRGVTGDMYRMGIGAALIALLVPLFLVAVVIKFFVDRSRASLRLADLKRKEAEFARMTQQVTEAKLAALQAQVEPHFLYNTLASVQALTEVDPARANEMTGHLIQYLRNALPKMRESVSTVGQEVELVRAYLSILKMRMGERLAFTIDVPEALAALPFPPLMLPSLVENAIKHGLEPQREGGDVHITASADGGRLRLVVSDTGRGFSETPGAGVGLANIRERLAALYGGGARFTLEANTPRGVVATIEVPAEGTRSQATPAATAETAPSSTGPAAPSSTGSAAPASTGAAEQPAPLSPPPRLQPEMPAPTVAVEGTFWTRTWEVLVKLERGWRVALYYLFLVLVGATAVAAVGFFLGAALGAFPVEFGDGPVSGPARVPISMVAAIVAFIVVTLALGIVTLFLYGLGFFLFAIAVFVFFVVLLSLSPILAPIALVALAVWWMAKKRKAQKPPPAPPRIEPTLAE